MLQDQISPIIKFASTRKLNLWLPLLFVAFAGGLLVLLLFAMVGYQLIYLHRAYPGVSVAGVNVGGMTRAEIMAEVEAMSHNYFTHPVSIRVENETWIFTGQELGLGIDVATTADLAYQVGRRGNFIADMLTHLSLLFNSANVELVIRYDTGPTNQILQELGNVVDDPPGNAGLRIGSDGSVDIILSKTGRRLHVGATQTLIEAAVLSQSSQEVTAFIQQVLPSITTEDLTEIQQRARSLLGQPFVFNFNADTDSVAWQLTPAQLGAMLNVVEFAAANGTPQLKVEIERDKLTPYMEEFSQVINQEASDAKLAFNDETGELEVLQHSLDARVLDVEGAYQAVSNAVANGLSSVQLPVLLTPPAISSKELDNLGIEAMISESTSYFQGSSEGRMKNIALAASKFDGVIIPPNKIFSFNEQLGPITKENGYDESLIIYGNRTTVGIGGGVCQVSTTVFRTAFFGGFELVERWAHGYRVGWYETNSVPGLDATIYTPDVDLKFRNDTDHYLLIQTSTNLQEGTITFRFYGTPTNREVIVSDPITENMTQPAPPLYEKVSTLPFGMTKQVDWAKEGMDVTVTRVVKLDDTILHEDEIISRYQPWRAVYQVGTAPPARVIPAQ